MRTALSIAIVVLLIAAGWLLTRPATDATGSALADSQIAYTETTNGPLLPKVVVTATKLGQGRKAVPGSPTTQNFDWPTLSESSAGMALLIPGSSLPATSGRKRLKELEPLRTGANARLKFDLYSWSMGTLVATTPHWIELTGTTPPGVPAELLEEVTSLSTSQRLMIVLPPRSGADPAGLAMLNQHDAHILVAEVLVSSSL